MTGNFIVYLIGYIIAIFGVAYGLSAAGLGTQWIVAVVLIMIGLGIVYALSRSQQDRESEKGAESPQQTTQVQSSPPPPQEGTGQSGTTTRH